MSDGHSVVQTPGGPFAIVPRWISRSDLSRSAIALYVELGHFADNTSLECWPSRATLAEHLGATRGSVDNWLKELRDVGAVTWVQRIDADGKGKQSNIYTLYREPYGVVDNRDPMPKTKDMGSPKQDPMTKTRHMGRPKRGIPHDQNEAYRTRPIELDPSELDLTKGEADSVPESVVGNCVVDESVVVGNGHGSVGQVQAVFDAWVASTGKSRARLDEKRRRLIQRALKEYPLEELLLAVQGWEVSDFHSGSNDRGKVYNDLGLILRDSAHIEEFVELSLNGRERTHSPNYAYLQRMMEEESAAVPVVDTKRIEEAGL